MRYLKNAGVDYDSAWNDLHTLLYDWLDEADWQWSTADDAHQQTCAHGAREAISNILERMENFNFDNV